MKILVLNGSPKREKSDTMHITWAFLEGMRDAVPHEIHVIDVIDRHIEYCTGCFACKRNGGACIHNDDMRAMKAPAGVCRLCNGCKSRRKSAARVSRCTVRWASSRLRGDTYG